MRTSSRCSISESRAALNLIVRVIALRGVAQFKLRRRRSRPIAAAKASDAVLVIFERRNSSSTHAVSFDKF